ncbi:hypothetical protein [Methylococcus capsulatus]|uniref:hypothetical protein n=1 Tax=Methylococcus capsulatus TaxID=414 RepID=UPI001C5297BA|nr:hypothetical protein [Methylococcus capsulatus]QXP94366.1 hypothetical protein KW113_03975 [Methylococcus capsulatus]
MPSPSDPARFISEFDAGEPSPEALHWVQRAFRAHLAGESLTRAFGFDTYSRGPRDALKHARIRRAIVQAASLLPTESTAYSKAKLIRSELLRLLRTWPRCTARCLMDELLLAAIEAADGSPPTGLTTIRDVIASS